VRAWFTPVGAVIAVTTLVALGLRAYQLSTPGYLLSITEYDDGSYFGSAIHLVHGILPYRDFVFVQPPGITLLMTPVALLAKVTGTIWGMAIGRILTMAASAASVLVLGLLVRHRGLATTILACGLLAVYPDAVTTARTVLLEPWLVLFCLLGALAVFDRDRVTDNRRRLILGGLALGFAGAIEAWAILPAVVILALCLPGVRRAGNCLAGMAVGFLVPVVPFAALAPANFFRDLVVAQVGPRAGAVRVGIWYRFKEMFGLSNIQFGHGPIIITAVIILGFAICTFAAAWLVTRRPPPALEWFALVTTILVVAIFLWPSQFFFHFIDFLVPFLAMAVALPAGRLVQAAEPLAARNGAETVLRWSASALAALLITVFTVAELSAVYRQATNRFVVGAAAQRAHIVAKLERVVPPGSCVLTDQVSYTIAANRFVNSVPGCSTMDDPTGMDLALGHGLKPNTGAGNVPAVAAVWRDAFQHAQYVLLTGRAWKRVAWNKPLHAYFNSNFRKVTSVPIGDVLYVRNGVRLR
jgi:hypothetical protein